MLRDVSDTPIFLAYISDVDTAPRELVGKIGRAEPIRGQLVPAPVSFLGIRLEEPVIDIGKPPTARPAWMVERDMINEKVDPVLDAAGVDQASTLVDVQNAECVELDGYFTPAQLRAIADVMDALAKEPR